MLRQCSKCRPVMMDRNDKARQSERTPFLPLESLVGGDLILLKGPIHPKLNCALYLCKRLHETLY